RAVGVRKVPQGGGARVAGRERLKIDRRTGVERIAVEMDDPRLRQRRVNEAEVPEVARQFVDDPGGAGRELPQGREILPTEPGDRRGTLRGRRRGLDV